MEGCVSVFVVLKNPMGEGWEKVGVGLKFSGIDDKV